MNVDFDQKIMRALEAEDAELFAQLDEQNVAEQLLSSFRGKNSWLVVLVYIYIVIFAVLMVYCGIQFFYASEVREMLMFGFGALFGAVVVSMTKIWYWMELNKNATMREMKRVELQLAELSQRLREQR